MYDISIFFEEVRILELGLEHLLFRQIKSYPERMGMRMVALILINTHMGKKQHFVNSFFSATINNKNRSRKLRKHYQEI